MRRPEHDLHLVREHDGGHEFIFIDTRKGTIPLREGGRTYNDVVAFPMRHGLPDEGVTYPVVHDDESVGITRAPTRRTSYRAMPMSVRRRYEDWARTQ